MDALIGSLEAGKRADVITVSVGASRQTPLYDPVSHLVNVAGRDQVSDVWVGGERLVAQRTLTRIDAQDLAARTRFWHDRLQ
jgi:5-methylthioadenosine/S-adenosylhomocysteine deaminase